MQQVKALHAIHIFACLRRISHREIQVRLALLEFDIGLKLSAHIGRNLRQLLQCLNIAIAGHQRKNQALPRIGSLRVRSVDGEPSRCGRRLTPRLC